MCGCARIDVVTNRSCYVLRVKTAAAAKEQFRRVRTPACKRNIWQLNVFYFVLNH